MKFIIIDQLSCLAHINTTQPQQIWFKLFIIIQYIQYIAILLPNQGWNQWNYQDGHFKLFSMIAQSQLIIPILADSSINFNIAALIFTILYLITLLTIILILLLFGIYDNRNPLEHNSIRNIIFNFLLITTNIFQMPLLFLFISQILNGHKTLNFQNQTLGLQSIINFFTLLLYSLQVFFSQYILRTYTFMPINNLQYKFNVFQPLHFILQTIIAILAFIEDENTLQYAQIAILHISLTFKICESYFTKPQLPFMNHLNFICSVIVEFINIIVSISIFTKGSLIDESQLLYSILFASTILYNLADAIYTRNILQTYVDINSQTCITFTQQMHSFYQSNRYLLKPEFFKLYFYYRSHKLNCPKQQKQHKIDNYTQQTTQIISCILNTELEKAKSNSKIMYEDLQLFYINFLAEFQNRPLIAFVELKRYENILNQQSTFFKGAKYYIGLKLQRLILSQQNYYKQFQTQMQQTQEKQLSISSIFETLTFQDEYIPKILQIIQDKIYFWNHQIKGFSTIYEIQRLALQQSQKVQDLGQEISKFCNFNIQSLDHLVQSNNVLNIKFISIFYSVIMNDYYGTQICEQTISEIYNIEHAQSEDIINNISFIEETAIIILLSMVRNRGQIINKDKKLLAKYFEFEEQEFNQIDNVNSLMPQYFAEAHDSLLNDFLMTSKSIFFDDYKILFGLSMQGFLVPQQLKLENDFSHIDDYVLIGCMSRIKSSSDFVLFSDDGYLIGCTQNFYDIFFQFTEQSSKFTPLYLHQISIYMLFPNIIDLLQQVKNEATQQCTDNYCRILKFNNLKDLLDEGFLVQQSIKQFASNNYDRSQTIQKSRTSQTTIDKTKILQQLADGIDNKVGKQKIINYLQSLPIFNIVVQNSIMDSLKKDENKKKQTYQCKIDLGYKIMGRKMARQTYFVMEIQDIRKIDETKTFDSIVNTKQFSNTQNYATITGQKSSENNNSPTQIINTETGLEQASVAIENAAPEVQKNNEASILFNKNGKKLAELSKYESQLQESGRDSYAPVSQRIQFISPTSKQSQQQGLIEKEFSELLGELDYVSAEVINEIESPEPSQVKGFSSNENKDKNENLLQQLQHNQQHQKREDLEISARRSRSSNTSGTSGISAIQVIKQFQQQKTFTQSLLMLFYINVLVIICILIYIIIHLINVDTYHNDLMQTLIHITAPLYFNRDFFKAFCCVWSLVFGQLQIVGTSDFILTQTIEAIKDLAGTMLEQIRNMYGTFVSIEVAGLLSNINLAFLYQQSEEVSFTYFVNFIQNIVDLLFQAQYCTIKTLDQLIDQNYLDNLLTLRYNLKNVKLMNVELLDSLNIIFLEQLDIKIQEYQVQISIEIIVLCFIVFMQIYYWNQLEKYCQSILLLVGRLQENQAQEQIIRFSFVSETLLTLQGKQSWKQQNYYSLIYQPLNLIGIESYYTQSKILKDFKQRVQGIEKKQKFIHHQVDDGIKKARKNQNVVLNSRVNDSNISILKEFLSITITYVILSIFIIGGYLLYNQQSTDLYPTQQLALNFIRFTSEQDITVSSAFVIKSQEILYNTLVEKEFYTKQQVQSQQQGAVVLFNIFIDYHDTYFQNLSSIYEYIIQSNTINNDDESLLLTLYSQDYCLIFSTTIPFCDIKSDFNQTYGEPDPEDNVREYISQGIQGIVSRIDNFFKQYYQYEITNKTYNPDLQHVQNQMHEPDFFHVIFEHFLYTTQGTYLFIDTIINILKDVMLKDQKSIYYYYLITGIILILIYILVYAIWFYKTNHRLILLRLILINLPIETLTEPHTLTLLKRLK